MISLKSVIFERFQRSQSISQILEIFILNITIKVRSIRKQIKSSEKIKATIELVVNFFSHI
jgi:hypothetical protein